MGSGPPRNTVRFLLAFLASIMAALLNPYGWGLYRHVGNLLVSSGVTSLISEYQSAPFGKPEAQVLEMVLLALVGLPALSNGRVDRYHLVHLLVWLHLSLTSIRNAPLFALVAAAPLAKLLDNLPLLLRTGWREHGRKSLWSPGWRQAWCCWWPPVFGLASLMDKDGLSRHWRL